MKKKDNLVWMDLEFTGLSDEQIIIETACIITDKNLNILEEGPNIVVHRTSDELKIIEDWPLKTHTESGLLEKVKNSETDIHQADELNVQFISKWVGKNQGILCGNSIHIDRRYIHKEMPKLDSYLNYRMIDVSSFKEVIKRWYKPDSKQPIERTVVELRYNVRVLEPHLVPHTRQYDVENITINEQKIPVSVFRGKT